MRLSTLNVFSRGVGDLLSATGDVAKTQNQISTGKRVLTPADDPVSSARVLQLNQEKGLRAQYTSNIRAAEGRLNMEETQLDAVGKIISRLTTISVMAGNGSFSGNDRNILAGEIEERMKELVNIMNSKDANGQYLFAGFKSKTQPFVDVGDNNFVYDGDEGQRKLKIASGSSIETGDNGRELFVDVPSDHKTFYTYASSGNEASPLALISVGNITDQTTYNDFYPEDIVVTFDPGATTYTVTQKSDGKVIDGMSAVTYAPGEDIVVQGVTFNITGTPEAGDTFVVKSSSREPLLTTVEKLMTGLRTLTDKPEDRTKLEDLLDKSMANLSNSETRVMEVRSRVGHRLNTLDSTKTLHEEISVSSEKLLSEIQDLDYTQAITKLNLQTVILQAAQQSFTKISGLSLFNFIR